MTDCYIAPSAIFRRWVIAKAGEPFLAWSGSRWVHHRQGLGIEGVQVSNFDTKMEAFKAAHEAGFTVCIEGYCADYQSITCYRCGMTSYSLEDVRHKYCCMCHKPHEGP